MISLLDAEAPTMSPPALPDLTNEIHLVRGERVMLDSALAEIYGVATKRLNEQLRRNRKRFPADFAFQLTAEEFTNLRSQIATSSYGGRRHLPWVFTEHGAIMLATSEQRNRGRCECARSAGFCADARIGFRQRGLARKLAELEKKSDTHDQAIAQLFRAIRQLIEPPARKSARSDFTSASSPVRIA